MFRTNFRTVGYPLLVASVRHCQFVVCLERAIKLLKIGLPFFTHTHTPIEQAIELKIPPFFTPPDRLSVCSHDVALIREQRAMMKESGSSPATSIQWVVIQHVLLEKENYIIHNLRWSSELEDALNAEGLLPTSGEGKARKCLWITVVLVCIVRYSSNTIQ